MTKRFGRNSAPAAQTVLTCEECGGRMRLTLVVPAPTGMEPYGDYLCDNCGTVKTVPLKKSEA